MMRQPATYMIGFCVEESTQNLPGAGADHIRAVDQSQDSQGVGRHPAQLLARAGQG
jgi:hypothetical protein